MSEATDPGLGGAGGAGGAEHAGVARRAPLAALTLLTIVPVPRAAQARIGAREVAASAPFFPLVGAVMGLVVGTVAHAVAAQSSSPIMGAAVATVLLAVATGALHLDGLADSADALGARGGSAERRLEIMRDSATGAYGTAAVAGWFLLVWAGLSALPAEGYAITLAIVLAWARVAAVAHARIWSPARTGGLGAGFQVTTIGLVGAVAIALLLTAGTLPLNDASAPMLSGGDPWIGAPPLRALAGSLVAGALAFVAVGLGAGRLIGGRTGDTLGATIALVEAGALFGAALFFG